MSDNYATATEIQDIAVIAKALESLDERMKLRESQVSLGDVPLFDVNGEQLGSLTYEVGLYVFKAVSSE